MESHILQWYKEIQCYCNFAHHPVNIQLCLMLMVFCVLLVEHVASHMWRIISLTGQNELPLLLPLSMRLPITISNMVNNNNNNGIRFQEPSLKD